MPNKKAGNLWVTNVISFILLSMLAVTGLINWLLLPKGYQAKGSFLVSLRHFFTDVHEIAAVLFIIIIAVHVLLHWGYVKSNLKKTRTSK